MKVVLENGDVIERGGRHDTMYDLNGQNLPPLDSASGPIAHLLAAILMELQWHRENAPKPKKNAVKELR